METRKKTNKKIVIAFVAMGVAIVGLIGALFGVYAAANQSVSTGFSVNYKFGYNVAAKVKTQYTTGGVTKTLTTNDKGETITDGDGFCVFDANDNDGRVPSFDIGEIVLTPEYSELIFTFTIVNLATGFDTSQEYYTSIYPLLSLEQTSFTNIDCEVRYKLANNDWVTDSSVSSSQEYYSVIEGKAIEQGQQCIIEYRLFVEDVNRSAEIQGGKFNVYLYNQIG